MEQPSNGPAASADAPAPAPPPAPTPAPPAAVAAPPVARGRGLLLPLVVGGALAVANVYFYERGQGAETHLRRALDEWRAAVDAGRELEQSVASARRTLAEKDDELAKARATTASDLARVQAEKEAAARRAAELADQLGEARAARDKAEARARELDALLGLLAKKKINVRRLAGVEAPPKLELEVVQVDDRRVPPVLVLRVPGESDGLEEGDRLYLVRSSREVGQALVERVDRAKGLVSARVATLDAGERVGVGDVLRTFRE